MSANFYAALLGFGVALIATLVIGRVRGPASSAPVAGLERMRWPARFSLPAVLLAGVLVCVCVALNVYFR
jgi:hypothetical protein